MFDVLAFKSNRQKEPNARGTGQTKPSTKALGLEVLVAVSTSRLSCKRAGKRKH